MTSLSNRFSQYLARRAVRRAYRAVDTLCSYTRQFGGPNGVFIEAPEYDMHIDIRKTYGSSLIEVLSGYRKEVARLQARLEELERKP